MSFVLRVVEHIPKTQGFVARSGQDRLSGRTHCQIEHSISVACQGSYFVDCFVLPVAAGVPDIYLV
jgi:hypothetical protein